MSSTDYWITSISVFGTIWIMGLVFIAINYSSAHSSVNSTSWQSTKDEFIKHRKIWARWFLVVLFIGPVLVVAWPVTLGLLAFAAVAAFVWFIVRVVRHAIGATNG